MCKIKRIIICIECLDYNYIQEIKPPNILTLDPHPAFAWGVGSRPSAAALMGGMLPVCQFPECYHRVIKDKWANPFFLTAMKKTTQKQFFLVANGWIIELLLPWMDKQQRKLNFHWHDRHESCPAKDITDFFIENATPLDSFFGYLHFFESHWPFYTPNGYGENYRKDAVFYLDKQVARILEKFKDTEIILTSDHNLPPKKVSAAFDVPSPSTMLSFLATNFKETRGWNELGIDAHKTAKDEWL